MASPRKRLIKSQVRKGLRKEAKEGIVGNKEINNSINLKSFKENLQEGNISNIYQIYLFS